MYKHIMVPLDGSALAECVLPHVDALAKVCLVENVTFVRVLKPIQFIAEDVTLPDKEWKRLYAEERAESENYLKQLVSRLKYDKVNVKWQVLEGQVADNLVDYAVKNNVDLIIIATHGRSGISRWVWGSVADRILRSACVPVLMVRAPGCVPGI